jgi:hypothetical protein
MLLISCHFSSVECNEPHDFTKSNNVFGAFRTGGYEEVFESSADSPVDSDDVDESDFAKVGVPFSRGAKIVLLPEARNMPPPTRLGLALSLACLASLNEFGPFVEFAGGGGVRLGGDGTCESADGDVLAFDGGFLSLSVAREALLLSEEATVADNFREREDIGSNLLASKFNDAGGTASEDDSKI